MIASKVKPSDFIYIDQVPYARPTALHVGWWKVLAIERYAHPHDVVGIRVLPADMTERNDVLYFNETGSICATRKPRS